MLSFSTIFEINVPHLGPGGPASGEIEVSTDDDQDVKVDDSSPQGKEEPTTNNPSIFTTRNVLLGLGGLGLAGAGSMVYSDYLDHLRQKKEKEKEQNVHPYFTRN